MKDTWHNSIALLSNFVDAFEEKSVENSTEVQEHLQCLINCIKELNTETKDLKVLLETENINRCSYICKHNRLQQKSIIELEESKEIAQNQNINFLKILQAQKLEYESKINSIQQELKQLNEECPKTFGLAMQSQQRKEEMVNLVGNVMVMRTEFRAKLKRARAELDSVRRCIANVLQQINEKQEAHTIVLEEHRKDISDVELDSGKWKTLIQETDENVKTSFENLEELNGHHFRNQAQIKTLQRNLIEKQFQTKIFQNELKRLAKKHKRFLKSQKEVEKYVPKLKDNFNNTQKVFKEKMITKRKNIDDIFSEIDCEEKENKKMLQEKFELSKIRDLLKSKLNAVKEEKESVKSGVALGKMKVGELFTEHSVLRTENSSLSESRYVVVNAQKSIEKYWEIILVKLQDELNKARKARVEVEDEMKATEEMLQKHFNDIFGFKRNNRGKEFEMEKLWKDLAEKEKGLLHSLLLAKTNRDKLQSKLNEAEEALRRLKEKAVTDIEDAERRIMNYKSSIRDLKEKQKDFEENNAILKQELIEKSDEFQNFSVKYNSLLQSHQETVNNLGILRKNFRVSTQIRSLVNEKNQQESERAIKQLQNNSSALREKSLNINLLLQQIKALRRETLSILQKSKSEKLKIFAVRKDIKYTNNVLFDMKSHQTDIEKSWKLSKFSLNYLVFSRHSESIDDMKSFSSVQEFFRERALKVKHAKSGMEGYLVEISAFEQSIIPKRKEENKWALKRLVKSNVETRRDNRKYVFKKYSGWI